MMIKKISYSNLNGLTNEFTFKEGLNAFVGSNGSGKTTSLDCLAILLFGESFSYNKTLERHINIKDKTQKIECKMSILTDDKIINEEGKNTEIYVNFGVKISIDDTNKLSTSWYVNNVKLTKKKYEEKLCEVFKIPYNVLDVEKVNVLRCLIDTNYINEIDNIGFYNFVRKLTNVITVQEFANNNNEYSCIREVLANCGYEIKDTIKLINNIIDDLNSKIDINEKQIENNNNYIKEISFNSDNYNKKIDIFNDLKNKIELKNKELESFEKKYNVSLNKDNEELSNKRILAGNNIRKYTNECIDYQNKLIIINNKINFLNYNINNNTNKIDILNGEIEQINNKEFKQIICPNCKEIVNKNELDIFNKNRENEIYKLKNLITESKKSIEDLQNELKNKINEKENYEKKIEILNQEIIKENENLNKLNSQNVLESQETISISNEIEKIEKELELLNAEIKNYYQELIDEKAIIDKIENIKSNINTLNTNINNYKSEKATYEQKSIVLKQFNIDYAKLIEERISNVFGDIKINMVKEGKNSKEKINCFAIHDDKPIFNYNTAPQKALGSKIISKIKQHLGIKNLPIMFDIVDNIGKKALDEIIKYSNGQVFCTLVEFEDGKELKLINDIKENK